MQTEFSTCTFSLPVSGDFCGQPVVVILYYLSPLDTTVPLKAKVVSLFLGSLETLAHLMYAFAYCQVLVINSCICLAKVASQQRVHRAVGTVRQPHKVESGRPTSSCDFPLRLPKGGPVAL